jgi:predicted permease
MSVRLALGVSPRRLAGMLIVESVILALLAGAGSIAAAYWGGGLLRVLLLPDVRWSGSPIHWRVVLFSLFAAVGVGSVLGALCAAQFGDVGLAGDLRFRNGTSGGPSRLGGVLVAMQAALSVTLLIGAALFIRSVRNVHSIDLGFDVDRVLFVDIHSSTGSGGGAPSALTLSRLSENLRGVGGIERVALASTRPLGGIDFEAYFPDADPSPGRKPPGVTTEVSPDYFLATGIRILRGHSFTGFRKSGDTKEVIVNRAMADALWPGSDPLNHCIRFGKESSCARVTGVVETSMLKHVTDKPWPQLYRPLPEGADSDVSANTIVLRVQPRRMAAAAITVRNVARNIVPASSVDAIRMSEILLPEYRPWNLGATLFSLFGGLALLVAAIGVYGTVTYVVSQRSHEFGVRIALGARASDVLRSVLRGSLAVVGVGVVVGLTLSIAAGRLVGSMLYGIEPSDPLMLAGAGLAMLAVAAAATLVPAWRAARTDPVAALRLD